MKYRVGSGITVSLALLWSAMTFVGQKQRFMATRTEMRFVIFYYLLYDYDLFLTCGSLTCLKGDKKTKNLAHIDSI